MDIEQTVTESAPETSGPTNKVALGAFKLNGQRVRFLDPSASEAAPSDEVEEERMDQLLEVLDASLSKLETSLEHTSEDAFLSEDEGVPAVAFIDPEVVGFIEETPSNPLPDFEERVRTMIQFQESGDIAGALDAATEIFVRLDGEGTGYFSERFGRVLSFACRRRLGALTACPTLQMDLQTVMRLPLDRRAGFLMSLVDGQTSFQDLILLSGMHEAEVLCLLTRLASWSVISTGRRRV